MVKRGRGVKCFVCSTTHDVSAVYNKKEVMLVRFDELGIKTQMVPGEGLKVELDGRWHD